MLLWILGGMYLFKLAFFSRYIPKSGIAGSYGNSVFSFLMTLNTVLYSGYTNLHSCWQCEEGSFFSTPSPAFIICRLFLMAILTSEKWFLIAILIWNALIINNIEHLFMCLLAICMSSLEKCLFRSSAHFFIAFLKF